jgi:hypothetical protein
MDDVIGRSFTAQLRSVSEGVSGAVSLSPDTGIGRSGWLMVCANTELGGTFKFEYLGKTEGRFHYAIKGADSLGDRARAALGVSTNGYLGLYHIASVDNSWKIEPRPQRGTNRPLRFWLRTAAGYRIAAKAFAQPTGLRYSSLYANGEYAYFLNANKGVIVEFELYQVTFLD